MTHDGRLRLRMRRLVRAPREAVFRALTEPRDLTRWWGPAGFTIPAAENDLRPGGGFRMAMRPPEGDLFHLAGEYLDVDPPERLSFTFRWEPPDPEDRETVAELSLRAVDTTTTELLLEQGDFATEGRLALHEEGWSESLDKLEQLLSPAGSA